MRIGDHRRDAEGQRLPGKFGRDGHRAFNMHVDVDQAGNHPASLSVDFLIGGPALFLFGFLQLRELSVTDQHAFFLKCLRIAVEHAGVADSHCTHAVFSFRL